MNNTGASFTERACDSLRYMQAGNLSAFPGLVHAFTMRAGGVSEGIYSSLNLGINRGDEPEKVDENYTRLCAALGIDKAHLVFSKQVHEDNVRVVSERDFRPSVFAPIDYSADGLITNIPNIPLIVFAADCIPILLYAADSRAVGAVHAGWRGTMLDIAGKAATKLCKEFGGQAKNIYAAIGAGIDKCCFETGKEVYDAALGLGLGEETCFITEDGGGKYHIDLKEINRRLLVRAGVPPENIALNRECTFCLSDKYWSHRATNGRRGVQAAVIALKD
jgi:hypothetical protein